MVVYVTYHNMDDGSLLRGLPAPVLGPAPAPAPVPVPVPVLDPVLGLLLPPPPLPPPLALPPPVVAGPGAAAAAIAAAAVGFLQRLQQVGVAAAAALPACFQRQYFRPSIGSNNIISTWHERTVVDLHSLAGI